MLSASAEEELSRITKSLSMSESNTSVADVEDVDEETMKQRIRELRKLVEGKDEHRSQLWKYSLQDIPYTELFIGNN